MKKGECSPPSPLFEPLSNYACRAQWGQRPETSILAHNRQGAKAGGGSSYDWKLNIVSGFCQSCREGGARIFQIFNRLLFIRLIRSLLSFALWIFCSLTAQQGFRLRDPLSIYYESWWCGNARHHLITYVIWSTYILALGNKCCSL